MMWRDVSEQMFKLAAAAGPAVRRLRAKLRDLHPTKASPDYGNAWFNPATAAVWVEMADGDDKEDCDRYEKEIGKLPGVKSVQLEAECGPPRADRGEWIHVKRAYSPAIHAAAQATNFLPGPTNQWFGGPSPLAATLAGGLVGAGLGYGAGAVGEATASDYVDPGRLRKTLALLGLAAGAAPGAYWGSINLRAHPHHHGLRALLSGWPLDTPAGEENYKSPPIGEAHAALKDLAAKTAAELEGTGISGLSSVYDPPLIERDPFNTMVWNDPRTPPPIRSATVGLVDAAAASRGSPIITPWDVARIAVGVGSGYESGLLVGKTLGALAGLKPEAQRTLQQAGTWAGILTSVVPLAFGR